MKPASTFTIFAAVFLINAADPRPLQASETGPVLLDPELIRRFTDELRTNHPGVLAAQARVEAAEAGRGTVSTWEDPVFTAGGMFSNENLREDEGDIIYGLEQKLPLFGKPGAARGVFEAEWQTEQAKAELRFQELRRDLVRALFRMALAGRELDIGRQDLVWLETIERNLEGRLATGGATPPQVLRIKNERAKVADRVKTLSTRVEHEQQALNRLLNREASAVWPELDLPGIAKPIVYNEKLVNLALRHEPMLRVLRREVERTEAEVRLSRRARYPEVAVGVQGRNYSGSGEFRQAEVLVGMSIPWGNAGRYRSEVRRHEARRRSAELDVADQQLSVREEIHFLTVQIDAARREALLYRDEILPRSEEALTVAEAAWSRGGPLLFTDLMESRRMLVEARAMYSRAVAEQYSLLSDLVLCCGLGDLDALENLESPESPGLIEARQP